jgi:prevent-host-death family protein
MIVTATQFKNNMGKYLKLAKKQEIIITRSGKSIAKIVPLNGDETPITDSLIGILEGDKNVDLKREREERLKKYEDHA